MASTETGEKDGARRLAALVRDAMEARHVRGLSALAELSGVSQDTIRAYLGGQQRPTRRSLAKLAAPLGLDERDLWRAYEDDPDPRSGQDLAEAVNRLAAAIEILARRLPER